MPAADSVAMPIALKAAIALYVAYCIGELVWMQMMSPRRFDIYPFVAAVKVAYAAFMCFALMRRWQWARMVMVFTTFLVVLGLALVMHRGVLEESWPKVVLYLMRIGASVMLFLPSVRRWFASPRT